MQTTSHKQGHQVVSEPNLSVQEARLAEACSSARSNCMREFLVEELADSDNRRNYEQFLSFIDYRSFSSFTHSSSTRDGATVEETVVKSGNSTFTIQMQASNSVELEPSTGFSAVVILQKADGSQVQLAVGDDENGVAFENSDFRLVQLLRTYTHQVARQVKTDEVRSKLASPEEIDSRDLEDVTFLSEQDFCERFPGAIPPSPIPAVAQARYRDMDVYVYQSSGEDSPDGVRYQLLASQDVMKFTGDLAEFNSSSSSIVQIEQGESSSLARLYQDVLRYDEKAEQTMKVLADAEKIVIESLQRYAREVAQREATATTDENYFRQIQRQFYVSSLDQDLRVTRLLKVTLPGGDSSISAVRIESDAGDLYPFQMSPAASARIISQVNTLNSLMLSPQRNADPTTEQMEIGDIVQSRLRDFTAMSSNFNHLNGQISTLLEALNGPVVGYQSESFSDGESISETTRIFTTDSVITMNLSRNRLGNNYSDGFVTVEKLLSEEQIAARNKFMSSVKHPDKGQQDSVASDSRSGEMIARLSFGLSGTPASADEIALLQYLRDSVEETVADRWNTARDLALQTVNSLDVKDLSTLSFIEKKEFTERFPGIIGSIHGEDIAKVSVSGADVYVYQSGFTVNKEPRFEVLVSPATAGVSLAVRSGVASSRFPAWTTELAEEEKRNLFNKLYATNQRYSAQIEAQKNEVIQRSEIFSLTNVEDGRIVTPKPNGRSRDFQIRCATESYGEIVMYIPPLGDAHTNSEPRLARISGDKNRFSAFQLTVEQTQVVQQQLSRRLADLVHKQLDEIKQETNALNGKGIYSARNWTETVETTGDRTLIYQYSGRSPEYGEVSVSVSSVSALDGSVTYGGSISGSGIISQVLEAAEAQELFEKIRTAREASNVQSVARPLPKPRRTIPL